ARLDDAEGTGAERRMDTIGVNRRTVLRQAGSWALASGVLAIATRTDWARAGEEENGEGEKATFSGEVVKRLAIELSRRPFARPEIELPDPFSKLSYDQYRDIRFRPEQAIWRGENLD